MLNARKNGAWNYLKNFEGKTKMTSTIIRSATKEVTIGFDRPFAIIGERINPTGRRLLAEEMKAGDFSRVEAKPLP